MADIDDISPQRYARTAGFLYLIIIIGGIFAELLVRNRVVVTNDAAATAANILADEPLFRWGFVGQLVPLLCNMFLAVILYELFKVVNKRMAMAVVCCSLVGSAIEATDLLNHFAPLILLKRGAEFGLDLHVLQAQAYMALTLQSVGFNIALTFFGLTCIVRGLLIYRSGFMPRVIGLFLSFEGLCYLANSFTGFLAPKFAPQVFAMLMMAGLAEVVLCLWLLARGVNVMKWHERAIRSERWFSGAADS